MTLEPTIEALANNIVERAVERGEVEWIGEVAQPMAMRVMLHMLGIAGDEETRWHQWSADRARLLEMIATRAERKTAHMTGESMTGYFRERLAERARGDAEDAISLLAHEAARGEFINAAEASDMLGVIMIAGNETTANLIGNGLWALMRHPDQMERLREEPERALRVHDGDGGTVQSRRLVTDALAPWHSAATRRSRHVHLETVRVPATGRLPPGRRCEPLASPATDNAGGFTHARARSGGPCEVA